MPLQPTYEDPNEKKVNDQLNRLYAALSPNGAASNGSDKITTLVPGAPVQEQNPLQAAQLSRIMGMVQEKDTQTDPKLQQISNLLDKVIAIKNPGQTTAGPLAAAQTPSPALPVSSHPQPTDSQQATTETTNGFYGLSDDDDLSQTPSPAIEAVIHGTQTIQSGSIVKLRLLQPLFVGNTRIPTNSFIFGPAVISGERVDIQLTNVTVDGHIYPISLKVYDASDGLEGLYVPGAITRDVVKENMSQGVSGLALTTLDPSLGAQAAAAGIETAKNLVSHKIRIVKVTLKEGHLAILKAPQFGH